MKKLVALAGLGAAGVALKRLLHRSSPPDLTVPETEEPQRQIEQIEEAADVPGGVRP